MCNILFKNFFLFFQIFSTARIKKYINYGYTKGNPVTMLLCLVNAT